MLAGCENAKPGLKSQQTNRAAKRETTERAIGTTATVSAEAGIGKFLFGKGGRHALVDATRTLSPAAQHGMTLGRVSQAKTAAARGESQYSTCLLHTYNGKQRMGLLFGSDKPSAGRRTP
jgi:hypothetical protein